LTQSGQHLLEYASRILADMQLARADLKTIDPHEDHRFSTPWQNVAAQ
jgi:DNA-binding transcriptional LysR family regulator